MWGKKYGFKEIGEMFSITKQSAWYIYNSPAPIDKKYPTYLNKMGGRERTREIVRIRDKHSCQDCGDKWIDGKRRFDVHHLNGLCGKKSRSYDKVSEIDGLITLCHKCHFNRPEHGKKMLVDKIT